MSSPNSGQAVHPFRQRYQLRDVWNAAASERDFDYTFWLHVTLDILVENGMRYFGYILVVLAGTIIAFLGLGGLYHVLPKVAKIYSLSFLVQNLLGTVILLTFIPSTNVSYVKIYRIPDCLQYKLQFRYGSFDASRHATRFQRVTAILH